MLVELELLCLLASDLPSNKQVNLTWSSITVGHKMYLPVGYIWPQVNLTTVVTQLATRCLCLGEGYIDILWDSMSASQLQLASQPAMWKMSTCQILGWSDSWWWENWGPNSPLGEWPTWPRPGKWHKWAVQTLIYHWHYLQGLFEVLYLCDLITYSCTTCREMLSRLFSVLINLLISFHHQSGVLLHQGTTF